MKPLLPLIALAAFVGLCGAAAKFKLPPFKLLDKDKDGSFTEAEVGKLMIVGARILTNAAGKTTYSHTPTSAKRSPEPQLVCPKPI